MAIYTLACIFQPQFVASGGATALVFSTPGGPTVVPDNTNYQLAVARVANVSGSACDLTMWRVNFGGSANNQHLVIPTISIPKASFAQPYFDLTTLWSIILGPGDAIMGLSGAGNALTVHGDGQIIAI